MRLGKPAGLAAGDPDRGMGRDAAPMNDILALVSGLDRSLMLFINGFGGRSALVDRIMRLIAGEPLIEGSFLFLFLWWLWFNDGDTRSEDRIRAIRGAICIVIALVLARALQIFLPGRLRPINDPTLGFVAPSELGYDRLEHWSSFPSDHAVIYSAIAMVIWMRNRWLGGLAFAWTLVFGSLPRLFLGLHYATDVLGGVLVGTAVGYLAQAVALPRFVTETVLTFERRHARIFYPLAVLFTCELITLFDDIRRIGEATAHALF